MAQIIFMVLIIFQVIFSVIILEQGQAGEFPEFRLSQVQDFSQLKLRGHYDKHSLSDSRHNKKTAFTNTNYIIWDCRYAGYQTLPVRFGAAPNTNVLSFDSSDSDAANADKIMIVVNIT